MAENVQCPVCTLYLHAGMNLSDHLETHPKEQVIRALVKMTISGIGGGNSNSNSSTLASAGEEAGEDGKGNASKKQSSDLEEKSLSNIKDNEFDVAITGNNCGATSKSSTSNCSLPNQSVSSNQNASHVLNVSDTKIERHNENERDKILTSASTATINTVIKEETINKIALAKDNIDQSFPKQNLEPASLINNSTATNASHSYKNSVELPNTTNVHHNVNVFGGNTRYDQQQRNGGNQNAISTLLHMPPPPPPASPQSHHPSQFQDTSRPIIPVGGNGSFTAIQPQHLPPPAPPHNNSLHLANSTTSSRQPHLYTAASLLQPPTNTHHAQSLKVIYTPSLPPPPPLQLFTYQPQSNVQQHQKPPPAYGAAISQIRSQHHLNKHQVAGSLNTQHQHPLQAPSNLQHQQLVQQQPHLQQHQTLQHNLRIQVPPPPPPPPISTKHTYSAKTNDLLNHSTSRLSQLQLHQQQSKADLSQQQQQEDQQQQGNIQNSSILNNEVFDLQEHSNKSSIKDISPVTLHNSTVNASPYPQVSISPSTSSSSIVPVTPSTLGSLGRHTNPPFAALLAAAAGAPSPSNTSSVLRYAESPVAHYLERENGDFIVQETPKHIVECVETDNGEFSVIERIYQSPPSVLHIHDDDDDDDGNDISKERMEDEQREQGDIKPKQHDVIDGEGGKLKDEWVEKQRKTSQKTVKTKKMKRKAKLGGETSVNSDIVDFVSISSDSGDEEEFIFQECMSNNSTTEKKRKNLSSSTCGLSMSTTSTQSSSVSPPLAAAICDDPPISTTSNSLDSSSSSLATSSNTSTQHNFGVTTNGTIASRKKSSKNTITVLSDVQLNLNEYLDLVGNIFASSKVAAQRKTFSSIAPIPLVKIEKEEPMDEYMATNITSAATLPNFKTVPPLKAKKHETEEITDIPSSSHSKQKTNNITLTKEPEPEEVEEKKPQLFINTSVNETTSIGVSNASTGLMTVNSSQVTSVIRMATTSQHQQQENLQNCLESIKNSNEAQDLSRSQQKVQSPINIKTTAHTPLTRKGPKKLVIKPKSTKTEVLSTSTMASEPNQKRTDNDKEFPTTSAKALQENKKEPSLREVPLTTTDVKVKNEPLSFENLHQQPQCHPTPSFSILEQHLSSKEPILEFKEEKPCITETSIPPTSIIKEMKLENNVNDDARVLYDFANSKKTKSEAPSTFPSSTSLFSSKQSNIEITLFEEPQTQPLSKSISNDNESSMSSSSTYSSQSVTDVPMPPEDQNESSTTNTSVATNNQTNHQNNQTYTDFHFNYLYNQGGNNVVPVQTEQVDIKNDQQFSSFYQNSTNNNNALLLEDSSSSKPYTDYQQFPSNHLHMHQHQVAATSHEQWFNNHYTTSEPNVTQITSNHSNSNMNSGLSVDVNSPGLDGSESGKYLDLDSCKREQNIDINVGVRGTVPAPPPPSSSTSCSFNGTTDNSMAGICSTAATLNMRTDEKMPAKGEISEQESNCDIDNSWSQPMYGDISARFFKTFPAIFPQDNGWNHEEYFAVQDLSASTTGQATNSTNSRMKSFEQTSSSNITSISMPIFSQNLNDNCNMDVMPSTSAKIRKRRKHSTQDGKIPQASSKRIQPTSTVTSQHMLLQHQNELPGVEFNFQHHQQMNLQQQHLQQPSTSTAYLAGTSNVSTDLPNDFGAQQQQQQTNPKQRTKVYECGHCNAKYSKLKDRNAHMIDVHNYVRQNRRLVCPATGLATPLSNSDMQDVAVPTTSAASSGLMPALLNVDCVDDCKQAIVKIENENPQRDPPIVEPISANLSAKTEVIEDHKQNLGLVALTSVNAETTIEYDTKPITTSLPLSLTTSSSKLTTLYRILVSFNMTTLKQNQNLSEFDENLIKSSIFFCYICRQNFNSVKLYDAHLTEHPAECFTCGKKFQRWKNFSLHLKRHLGWKEFGCTVCDKKFVVRSALVEHMRMHSGLSPLKCKVCGKHFKRYSNLTQHRKRHTKQIIRRKEYVCYCGEVLPSKARFLWHKETHDSKPKCCPHCCDRFVHVNSLRRHIRLAHSDKFDYTEPMECSVCKQIFAKASMKAHMATHSTETQYDCAICNKSFSTKWNLKIHSWVHANRTAKPFKCEHCPKAFVREVDFKNHMNSHKQIKPYTCEVCGCKFIRKYNYMRHRREHHGNKKYTCDLCKKSFHRHYYLIEHRRIHTGERPFQCSICGKSSTTKTNHNKHLKIHHSRDPYTVEA